MDRSLGRGDEKSVLFPWLQRRAKGKGASEMEGCWTETISPEQSSLFPVLLQLSTEGKGFEGVCTWLGAATRAWAGLGGKGCRVPEGWA